MADFQVLRCKDADSAWLSGAGIEMHDKRRYVKS
jgi:hypothetical protein